MGRKVGNGRQLLQQRHPPARLRRKRNEKRGEATGHKVAWHRKQPKSIQARKRAPPRHGRTVGGGMTEAGGGGAGFRDERVPQWGVQETRELIAARGELEREAAAAAGRSAKTLWEAVADALRARGYRRTADQCKCKWKNLVNRYKGKETSDPQTGRQCPFFEELHAVFTERARNMQRQLLQSESGTSVKGKLKRPNGDQSSGESDDGGYGVEVSDDEKPMISKKRKGGDKGQLSQRMAENSRTGSSSIHDLLQEFLVQQQHVDMLWHETMERRAQERLIFEQEWRQSMQKLEQERLMLEQSWIEQEEKRRMSEEARAQKRDSLMTTLLNKLLQEDL